MRVTVVGLGYVGLTAAAATAHLGHHVLGVDIDLGKVRTAQAGEPGIYEPRLGELVRDGLANGHLRFAPVDEVTEEPHDVVVVAVGTPSMPDGSADMAQILAAIRWSVASSMTPSVIVMKSSVLPGTGVKMISEELRDTGFSYVSNPEFLREGSAIEDWLHPTRIVIGGQDPEAMQKVESLYSGIETPIIKTDITSAEMIKYTSNALLVTKISFINEITMLCERVGGHIDDVTRGIGLDPRIGPGFLGAGIGWGGSCFPKDVRALEYLALANGNRFDLLGAVISVNERQRLIPLQSLREVFADLRDVPVAVLGLTFKPGTDDLREAPAIPLIEALVKEGAQVSAYDPVAIESAGKMLPRSVKLASTPEEALLGARAAILATEWPELVHLPWDKALSLMVQPRFIFDGRNALDMERLTSLGFKYRGVGRAVNKVADNSL